MPPLIIDSQETLADLRDTATLLRMWDEAQGTIRLLRASLIVFGGCALTLAGMLLYLVLR